MPNLYPVFEVPTILTRRGAQAKKQPSFKKSYQFDYSTGDFVRGTANRILFADGKEAWKQWCMKTVATQRYACRAYNGDIGIDRDSLYQISRRTELENTLSAEIREALLSDPAGRTAFVSGFAFAWKDDQVSVSFNVLGAEGQSETLQVEIK